MAYSIYIREADSFVDRTWHDVTESIVSSALKTRCGFTQLGSGADLGKLTLSYRTYDLATASIFGSTVKRIRVVKDSAIVFEGYSDGASSVEATEIQSLAWVKVTAYPYAKALEDVELSEDWVGYDLTVKQVAESLWSKMLLDCKPWLKEAIEESVIVEFPEIQSVIPLAKVSKGEKPMSVLVSLFSEYCYSMLTYGNGRVSFIRPYSSDPLKFASIPFESVEAKPNIKTSPYVRKKSPEITIAKTIVKNNVEVYSLTTGNDGKNAMEEIPGGGQYPEEGDAEIEYTDPDTENDNVQLTWAKDFTVTFESRKKDNSADGDISFSRFDTYGDKAYYRIRNNDASMLCYLNQLKIKAGVVYYTDKSYVLVSDTEGEKEEIETEWIQTSDDAILYAKAIADESRCDTLSIVFKSDVLNGFTPGDLVKIGNIPAVYIIKSIETDLDTNVSTYSCNVYDIADISTDTFYRPPSVLNRGPAGKDAPEMYYLWSSSPDKLIAKQKKYWRFSGKKLFMLFHGKVMGDFGMQDWEKSWEKLMESRTETYNFLWAKVGENGEPFRIQGVSPMDFSVLATPPSYTVNPRRKDQFKITVKLTRLNGMKGASSLVFHGGPYNGIVINSISTEDEWEILVFQNTTTSLEFKLKASIGGVEKVIGLSGTMIQNSSKYMGAVDTLPTTDEEGNKLLEGDWCVLKSDNLMYVYKGTSWKSITDSEVSSFDELEKMSTALMDMIAIGSTKSTTATVLGVFKLLCADNGFIKFLKTWALYCGAGDETSGFYCRIADHDPVTGNALSKPVFIVKYDGQTVFQIDPSSGNVFFGTPNSGLTAPASGFMYRASDSAIVSKGENVVINSDGAIYAKNGSFSGNINADSGSFSGDLNGATGAFNGSFITPSLESRPPKTGGVVNTVTLSADANSQYTTLNGLNLAKNELHNAELSVDSRIKYIKYVVNKLSTITTYRWSLMNSSFTEVYYMQARSDGTKSTKIPASTLKVGYSGDVLVFNVDKIPYSSQGLEVGQIYQNTSHQLFIKTE